LKTKLEKTEIYAEKTLLSFFCCVYLQMSPLFFISQIISVSRQYNKKNANVTDGIFKVRFWHFFSKLFWFKKLPSELL